MMELRFHFASIGQVKAPVMEFLLGTININLIMYFLKTLPIKFGGFLKNSPWE